MTKTKLPAFPDAKKRLANVQRLMKMPFFYKPDDPKLTDLKATYSKSGAVEFFEALITQEKNGFIVNKEMLDELAKTGRLIPLKDGRYSGLQLMQYYLETKPR